jgi:type IV pilus assembly protein PilQ
MNDGREIIRMNRFIAIPTTLRTALLAALGALACSGAVAAETPPANQLQSIDVQPLSGQGLQIVLTTSGPAAEPVSFTIDNPARISLDLANTGLALAQRRIDVRKSGLDSIVAAEGNGRSRLVLNLEQLQPYQTRVEGNRIILTLGEGTRAVAAAAAPAAAPPRAGSAGRATPRTIPKIDFRRSSDGLATGRLVVTLTDPRTPINLRQQGNRILVDFVGAELAQEYQRSYDVTDFATPVTGFDAIRTPSGTSLAISAAGDFEQLAYQSDDQYVIEIQPRRLAKAQVDEKPVYTGERMSATFQDIPTRTLLQLIAETSGRNIFVTDSVAGNVSLRVDRVPWDQVLDIVLQLEGLDKRVQDNVILVGPTEEIANREKARMAATKDIQDLAPLRTEYLQVNYAQAADIAGLIQSQGSSGGGGGGGKTLLSARGSVTIDTRTNMLLIQDTPDSISNIRQLVATLDIPVRQVQIEARIVVVSEDFSRDLGVRFGFTGTETNGPNGLFAVSGAASAVDTIGGSAISNLAGGGGVYPVTVPTGATAPSRYNVNLPVSSPAGVISTMILGSDYIVDLELSAAQAEGKGEVISSPTIKVTNQQEAYIEQGQEIPYQEAASSGAATIQFKKAVLSLRVTPQINPDNTLKLKINVKKDRVGQVIVGAGGVNVPSIDTSEIDTEIVMGDGETAVLGGILETERRTNEKKVPLLGDIPVLGHLFKSSGKVNNKNELLIFVTPKIQREGVRTN